MDITASWLIAVVVLFLLSMVDVVLTLSIISQGGREFNPLIRWIVKKKGGAGLILFKLFFFFLVLCVSICLDSSSAYSLLYLDFVLLVVMCLMYWDLVCTPGFSILSLKCSRVLSEKKRSPA